MNAMQRKMVRRLEGYRTQMFDERRMLDERRRDKQETLRNAQLSVFKLEARLAEISSERMSYQSSEIRSRYVAEAREELADARAVVADIEGDIRALNERSEQIAADLAPAARLAQTLIQISGAEHEDYPEKVSGLTTHIGDPLRSASALPASTFK
jgi:chromosome segregation ATPase